MSQADAPLFVGKLAGLRSWSLADQDRALGGLFQRVAWPAGRPLRAACLVNSHAAPAPACSCGIYALHPTRAAARALQEVASPPDVVGIVEAWGAVEVHPDGFRAEYARPNSLV